jgi:hypothetical protein
MQRYKMASGIRLCAALLAGTADPGAAWPAFTGGGALSGGPAGDVQLVRAGDKNVNVNRNKNVNRNTNVNKNVNRNTNVNVKKNTNVNVNVNRPVRVWTPRPHYGAVVAGVTLGTIIVVSAAGAVPVAPSPTLCWYWTDPAMTGGYWDYCK